MVFKVSDRLPEDCALRRGTLISGVTRPDPMQPAIDQIERALRAKVLRERAMNEAEQASKSSEPAIHKPSENT